MIRFVSVQTDTLVRFMAIWSCRARRVADGFAYVMIVWFVSRIAHASLRCDTSAVQARVTAHRNTAERSVRSYSVRCTVSIIADAYVWLRACTVSAIRSTNRFTLWVWCPIYVSYICCFEFVSLATLVFSTEWYARLKIETRICVLAHRSTYLFVHERMFNNSWLN